ncbi:Protein KRI1-like protein [Zancudomyces culisetae]|uniref:Protein KRI1-like protein n=1 Tax=Zancudomyces culisetae TaxID=1213189 RepID=A0A1R1PP80_ZANCU|nr:Protein KRI1-like protein [Zancudomyces culisetae]|eukprot:OMH82764.1 Protein KRI1-like protein [Zancudomyces culisetae]
MYEGAENVEEMKLLRAVARQKRYGKVGSTVLEYVSDSDDEDMSSSSEEDEVGEIATPQIDLQILKTLEAIKKKDDSIYDQKTNFFSDDEDDDQEEGDLFSKKVKSENEIQQEEDDYKQFLIENLGGKNSSAALEELDFFKDSKTDPDKAFLVDYILNRGWVEKEKRRPNYEQIVNDELDEVVEYEAETFESQFGHRHQEPGGTSIQTHSRTIDDSVRREDNKRKLARNKVAERKKQEKEQKFEELKRLKNLKKAEIMEKLAVIKEITGNKNIGFGEIDLEGDYDPDKYDTQMNSVFGNDYYLQDDKKKPQWDDDIDIDDIVAPKKKSKKSKDKGKSTEPDVEMDADYLPGGEMYDESNGLSESHQEVSLDDDQHKEQLKAALDEYHQLDYEDIIGGNIPTRFKYHNSKSIDYGLTPAEILLADEKDLNEYYSLKKLAPFRPQHKASSDLAKTESKKRKYMLKLLKKNLSQNYKAWEQEFSAYNNANSSNNSHHGTNKKKRKSAN